MANVSMSAASPDPSAEAPAADPRAIRASLPSALAAEFDREWELVLEQAKLDKDLGPIRSLLVKWRHVSHAERADPGINLRLAEKAAVIEQKGQNPNAVSVDEVRELIDRRLGR
jgi:uncharacterized protein HemY